ncbi:MAG: right-handed parallel beta-helix repeat-containing protein [Thermoplasmata archaeon]|nr:MAG: right-handed parallel beta-helix repeat-containing protein [Thermoplasmata archaeon]
MNTEKPDITVVPDNMLIFTAEESIKNRESPQIRGTRGYKGTSPPVGDWTITGEATVWNETITLNGDLTVTETGNLTLINVTLKLNCSYNGQYHIEVLGGGGLYIYDYDWNRFTEDDASNITVKDTSYKFLFLVREGSLFEMRNSELSYCGYEWGNNYDHSGLWINTDYTIIEGNLISNSWNGLVFYGSDSNIIDNNTIFHNSVYGILFRSSHYNDITNCKIYSNIYNGIYLYSPSNKNNITNTDIYDNLYHGIALRGASSNNLSNNHIYNNSKRGIILISSSNNIIHNNKVYNNLDHGIYLDSSSNNVISDSYLAYNRIENIHVTTSSHNNLIVNSILNCLQDYDIGISSDSHLISLNTTFNKTKARVLYSGSTLKVQWYVEIKVINHEGIPIKNVTVYVRDNINGNFNKNFTTDVDGVVKRIVLTEYVQEKSKITYFTPHNISAVFYRHFKEYIAYSVPEPWIGSSKTITFRFKISGNNTWPYQILYPGWNLISLPYIQSNSSIIKVLKPLQGYYDAVQLFNSSDTLDQWKHYHISKPSHLNDLEHLNHKLGFWIHITHPNEIHFHLNGTIPSTDQMIELNPGWNIVGYPSIVNRVRDDALNNLELGEDIKIIYYFDAKTKSWESLEADEFMKGGLGYYIYSNNKRIWIVNSTIPPVYNIDKDLFYNTIQEGIDDADELDILEIAGGIFHENVKINKSVILIGEDANRTIVIGGFNVTSNKVYLLDIGIHNSSNAIISNNANEICLSEIEIHDCTYGLWLNNSTDIVADNFIVQDSTYGIYTDFCSGITISNFKVSNGAYGIYLNDSSTTLSNLKISNSIYGVYLDSSEGSSILSSIILNCTYGTYINSSSTTMSDLNISKSIYGINLVSSDESSISSCTILNSIYGAYINNSSTSILNLNIQNTNYGIQLDSCNFDILSNIIVTNSTNAIYFDNSSLNTISNLNIQNSTSGIHIETSNIDTISKIIVTNSTNGIYIDNSSLTTISNLNIQNSSRGIYIDSSNINTISKVMVTNGTNGAYINNSSINTISGLDIHNSNYGIYLNSCDGIYVSSIKISKTTYGIYFNNSNSTIDGCTVENSDYGIYSNNSSYVNIVDGTFQNDFLDLLMANSYFITLNTYFNVTRIKFLDPSSSLTIKWYLHVLVEDVNKWQIEGANVWIKDNENGTFDQNFTTGSDGYVWYIILTERIQNLTGNVSFNPYWINVSYYDPMEGWLTFTYNPRNVSVNGSLFEIRTEIFQSLEAIPEFSHILLPIMAITASFVFFRKKRRKIQ